MLTGLLRRARQPIREPWSLDELVQKCLIALGMALDSSSHATYNLHLTHTSSSAPFMVSNWSPPKTRFPSTQSTCQNTLNLNPSDLTFWESQAAWSNISLKHVQSKTAHWSVEHWPVVTA
jgi:hypothetical protein